jgi:hypothetical protein
MSRLSRKNLHVAKVKIRIETPVELIERLDFPELSRLDAAAQLPFVADRQFVLKD